MLESEAKTKWCPFVRLSAGNNATYDQRKPLHAYCITDECIAWVPGIEEGTGSCGLCMVVCSVHGSSILPMP